MNEHGDDWRRGGRRRHSDTSRARDAALRPPPRGRGRAEGQRLEAPRLAPQRQPPRDPTRQDLAGRMASDVLDGPERAGASTRGFPPPSSPGILARMPDTTEVPRDLSRATLLAENRALRRNVDAMLKTQLEIATSIGVLARHVLRKHWSLRFLAWISRLLSRAARRKPNA